jgi:poly-gamma-glutamate capsule biosynthesis protein CapA/YwtB (metallophosphatase superfamily)
MKSFLTLCLCITVSCGILHAQGDTTTLVITGDMMLSRGVAKEIQRVGRQPFFDRYKKYFAGADIGIVNYESAVGGGYPAICKRYTFDSDPRNLPYLKKIGITHLNLANNHAIDFGACGLQFTQEECARHGLHPLGSSADSATLFTPTIIRGKGKTTIALFACVRLRLERYRDSCAAIINQDTEYNLPVKIREYKRQHPEAVVVALLHWGAEEVSAPSKAQEFYAHALIESGADLIVGCGSHTLQEYQTYKTKRIYYSLGDFIFDRRRDEGAVLTVRICGREIVEWRMVRCF